MATGDMTADGKAEGSRGPSMIATIAVVAVLSLLAAGGGWFVGNILAPQTDALREHVAASEADDAHGTDEDEAAPSLLFPLEPITTNLAYPSENWVRVEVSLVFSEAADATLAQLIHQDILAYLRTVSLQQIEGARGFQHLKEDLTERASLRSEGKVERLLFRTFVVE